MIKYTYMLPEQENKKAIKQPLRNVNQGETGEKSKKTGIQNPKPKFEMDIKKQGVVVKNPVLSDLSEEKKDEQTFVPKRMDIGRKKSIVRTYESDSSDALKDKKASIVDIMSAQKRKDREIRKSINQQSNKAGSYGEKKKFSFSDINRRFVLKGVIIFFIVIAMLLIFYGVYNLVLKDTKEKIIEPTSLNELIFVNDRIGLDVTGLDKSRVISKILDIKDELNPTLGTVVNVYLAKDIISKTEGELITKKMLLKSEEFISGVGIILPPILSRTITGDFMFGFHMTGSVEPFLVLKVDSFENAFAGMIGWEGKIKNDLNFLIEDRIKRILNRNATSSVDVLGVIGNFKDEIYKNKDIRIIREKEGESILLYSLPDRKTIVITTNENTLAEILDRLARVKFTR